jgi:anti-anti-sigma factor
MRAVEALQEFARKQQIPEKIIFELALALEECASNIVNHALKRDPRQTFRVSMGHTGEELFIELRDRASEFDPTAAKDSGPKTEDDLPGGWGIQLVRRYMDEFSYKREAGENILRLGKRLTPAAGGTTIQPTEPNQPKPKHKIDMPLEIQIQKNIGAQNTGAVTVKLTGSLDTATAPDLERQLAPVLGGQVKDAVFDLAQLKFISSAGLRVFSTTRKTLRERGGQTSFVNMQPQIQEVFEIIKALPGVAIFKSEAELDKYLAARQRSHEDSK